MMTLSKPQATGNLSERAMLVRLTIRGWTGSKVDKQILNEAARNHHADASQWKANKLLLPKGALDGVKRTENQAREAHYLITLPWTDGGLRVLSSAKYFDYTAKVRECEEIHMEEVRKLSDKLPDHMEQVRYNLGDTFSESDYPSPQQLLRMFSFRVDYFPMSDPSDFRCNLGDDAKELVAQSIRNNVRESLKDVYTRIHTVVARAAETLPKYKVTADGAQNIFRDSLVDNITNLVELIPDLNFIDDPDLASMAADLKSRLCCYSADTLRRDDNARATAAQAAQEIMDKVSSYI